MRARFGRSRPSWRISMAADDIAKAEENGPAQKLRRSRPVLLAAGFVLALIAYLEPDRILFLIAGFLAIAASIAFISRNSPAAIALAERQARRVVWPDASMKAVAEALDYPAYILDANAIMRYANAASGPVFGAPVIGDPASLTFRQPEVARLISRAVSTRIALSAEYSELVPGERWFSVHVNPVPRTGGGEPEFFLLSFQDFTEARRSDQMRSDFIANASHELRTPLASLRGFLETIKGPASKDPAAVERFLDIMLDQAERMSRLIDDLLSLSRIEMKSHLRPEGEVALEDVLGHVVNALQPLADKLGVAIEKRLPAERLVVRGDRDELIQVFENLIENACKYGDSGKKVEIAAEILEPARTGQPRRVEIAVRDFGPGISAEHLPRLTERFYRVNVSSSRDKQGTGLGLAIVKHILNRHGTRLAIASTPGEGARFSVIFPLAEPAPAVEN